MSVSSLDPEPSASANSATRPEPGHYNTGLSRVLPDRIVGPAPHVSAPAAQVRLLPRRRVGPGSPYCQTEPAKAFIWGCESPPALMQDPRATSLGFALLARSGREGSPHCQSSRETVRAGCQAPQRKGPAHRPLQ